MNSRVPLSVIVLTFNEERNLSACLESLAGLTADIFVVDSGSTDGTLRLGEQFGAQVVSHPFAGHARQWQWALASLPLAYDWVLALDADQSLTKELRAEIAGKLPSWTGDRAPAGAYVNRRQIFRGRWIRHGGYYPKHLLKLFHRGVVAVDERDLVDHHFVVRGPTVILDGDLIEDNRNEAAISVWIDKHNRYAVLQAREEEARRSGIAVDAAARRMLGSPDERTRWRKGLWNRLPLFVRPFAYFFYRYVVRLGFLDGKEGLVFHFMQACWYRLLVDINRDELRRSQVVGANASTALGPEHADGRARSEPGFERASERPLVGR